MPAVPAAMPILTTIRQSPAYLYVKTYCVCAVVSLFQVTPVSSPLRQIKDRPYLKKHRNGTTDAPPRVIATEEQDTSLQLQNKSYFNGSSVARAPSSKSTGGSGRPVEQFGTIKVVNRWFRRAVDLAQIKKLLRHDDNDFRTYPEINWDATVRCSSSLHPEEQRFIQVRRERISSNGANSLHTFLDLPENETIDLRDVPLVALGGSGGGYRAMYGFAALISASKKLGLWDCLTWTAAVSGSCWTLAGFYTIGNHNIKRLIRHYLAVAKELSHPMSIHALDTVVRSSKGVYFLIGPLVRKVRSGIIGLGIMDLYGTLATTYQLLSREPRARLSRATFQFSKVWSRSGIDKGIEPMPIFTAVRRAPKDSTGVKPHTDSSLSKGQPPTRALTQHQTKLPKLVLVPQIGISRATYSKPAPPQNIGESDTPDSSMANGFFQWFEISPLEVGCPDVQRYIPTWSWGRTFVSGKSFGRLPEQSLALLLGQCTSAPAGPLTAYISALLASLPKGTIMSRLLLLLNDFIRMKNWERLWGNPIRAGHDPNPFYGHNNGPPPKVIGTNSEKKFTSPQYPEIYSIQAGQRSHGIKNQARRPAIFDYQSSSDETHPRVNPSLECNKDGSDLHSTIPKLDNWDLAANKPRWEAQSRVRLMDSGMSNNLPSHILARPERGADIILAFDASSDVQKGSAIQRIRNFAGDCHLELEDHTALFEPPQPRFDTGAGLEIESKFLHQYARVFRGERENGHEIYLIYCPLLPNGCNPDFDPSVNYLKKSTFDVEGE